MSDRNWEKEYNEMLAACLESGRAYENIIAEKNSELAELRAIKAAARELVNEWNGLANSDLSLGYGLEAPARKEVWKSCADDLTAALNESETS